VNNERFCSNRQIAAATLAALASTGRRAGIGRLAKSSRSRGGLMHENENDCPYVPQLEQVVLVSVPLVTNKSKCVAEIL
jgi:hypothetical protein